MSDLFEEIPPGTDIINAIRAERSSFHSWVGEVLDNSLDAGATSVALTMTGEKLAASDNGSGITLGNDQAVVKIAQHAELSGTKLGRYGVGMKYKAIQHGNILRIRSVSSDGLMTRKVDWSSMLRAGKWMYPQAMRRPASGQSLGTVITIEELTRRPSKADIVRTTTEIQRRYYPAIENGKVILLNGEPVAAIAQPELTDVIEQSREFPGGRSVRLRGGMLVDPANAKLRQVDLAVAYRIIDTETNFGCDSYGGIRSMFARVELFGRWGLSKFKDELLDPHEDELEAWVEDTLRPVLEKCQSASMQLNTKKLEDLLNSMLPEKLRAARPVQTQRLGRVGEKREHLGGRSDTAKEASSGPTKKKNQPRGIMIEFADGLNEEFGYGRLQVGKSASRIQLARDNPHVCELMNHRDLRLASIGLYGFACLIYEGELGQGHLCDLPTGLRAWRLGEQQALPQAAE